MGIEKNIFEQIEDFINDIVEMDEDDFIGYMCYYGSCDAGRKNEKLPSYIMKEIHRRRELLIDHGDELPF